MMNTHASAPGDLPPSNMVLSYRTMRFALGILGVALPIVLVAGGVLSECCVRPAISAYYYSPNSVLHGLFIGTMFAIGVFLICYKGYPRAKGEFLGDNWVASATGIGAFGIAIFPTDRCRLIECGSYASELQCSGDSGCESTYVDMALSFCHNTAALLFFLSAALMAHCLFTKSRDNAQVSDRKKRRNRFYRACAWVIIVMVILIVTKTLWPQLFFPSLNPYNPILVLETVAIWAFGLAWLVKGIGAGSGMFFGDS